MDPRSVFNSSIVYEAFQATFGFSGARRTAISEYLDLGPGDRVLDVGCGPGRILTYLPPGIDYVGFDVDNDYIEHANATYAGRGRFRCQEFDAAAAAEFGPADAVMLNGVLHHVDDSTAAGILGNAVTALKPGGRIFTLDGCYRLGQNRFAKWLLDSDRGEHVRVREDYVSLLEAHFADVRSAIREDLARLPYTFLIMTGELGA